jgi:hypothetical protein
MSWVKHGNCQLARILHKFRTVFASPMFSVIYEHRGGNSLGNGKYTSESMKLQVAGAMTNAMFFNRIRQITPIGKEIGKRVEKFFHLLPGRSQGQSRMALSASE